MIMGITTTITITIMGASPTVSAACPAIRTMATTMPEAAGQASLLRLLAWLSPAFPVGSFSYSHGLEFAVEDGTVTDAESLRGWVATLLESGSAWNDAVLLAEAWRLAAAGSPLDEVAALAEALAGSSERHLESIAQGTSFLVAATNWKTDPMPTLPRACAYCVAVGATAGATGVDVRQVLAAWLQAFVSNQLQVAIRLSVIGQVDAAASLAAFEPDILAASARAETSTLDDLGSSTLCAEIASMRHEIQYSRLFRS